MCVLLRFKNIYIGGEPNEDCCYSVNNFFRISNNNIALSVGRCTYLFSIFYEYVSWRLRAPFILCKLCIITKIVSCKTTIIFFKPIFNGQHKSLHENGLNAKFKRDILKYKKPIFLNVEL